MPSDSSESEAIDSEPIRSSSEGSEGDSDSHSVIQAAIDSLAGIKAVSTTRKKFAAARKEVNTGLRNTKANTIVAKMKGKGSKTVRTILCLTMPHSQSLTPCPFGMW